MIVIFSHSFYFSTCLNGEWDCGSQVCDKKVGCPANQVYSTNALSCPKTCDNINSWKDCGMTFEGCTCPEGQVLSSDVSCFNRIMKDHVQRAI